MKTIKGAQVITSPAYTYNDYLILPEGHRDIEALAVDTSTSLAADLRLNIPIVGANMGHMGGRMAEKLSQLGGIGILSQDFSLAETKKRIRRVKRANPYFHMPIVLQMDDLVANALALMSKRHFDCVIIVDKKFTPIGLITQKDLPKYPKWERLKNVMKQKFFSVPDSIATAEASRIMLENQIHHLPVVDARQKLVGCLTPLDITLRTHNYRPSLDNQGRLLIGVAMGMKAKEGYHPFALAKLYIEAGVDVLVLDVANGYLDHFVNYVTEMRREIGSTFPLIAGNVADYHGAMRLLEAGCDTIKIGIGPGGACTTRRETGVGVPQAQAVEESLAACQQAMKTAAPQLPKRILADGGIKSHNDLIVAILLGAPAVMIGSLFAGTYESAFETEIIDGEMWKRWRGNASSSAATFRREQIYNEKYITEDLEHSEGADGRVKVTGAIAHKIVQLIEPLKQVISQTNSHNLNEFQSKKEQLLRLRVPVSLNYRHLAQLNFDELYIKPQPSNVASRKLVQLNTTLTPALTLQLPYLALPSSFVQKKICTIMAQLGGMGFLSRKRPHETVQRLAQRINKVKARHPFYFFPSIQEEDEEIGKTIDFLNENAFSCVIIVKDFQNDWTPTGIATREDLFDRSRTDTLREVVKSNIYKVKEGIDLSQASEIMLEKGIHHLPVIDHEGQLVGCITPRDMTLRVIYGLNPNVDANGRLRVGVALQFENANREKTFTEAKILDQAGADALLIESDDGYASGYLELIKQLRRSLNCPIVASGVATYSGAIALFEAGADIVKVGCHRAGVPLIEAIAECSRAAQAMTKSVVSDDDNLIHCPREANISLLMGCQAVGLRQVLADTYENSRQATLRVSSEAGSNIRKKLVKKKIHGQEYIMEDLQLERPEIRVHGQINQSVINVIVRFLNGLRSACTYSSAASLVEYQQRAIIGLQSTSGYQEGKPHAFATEADR